MSNRIIAKTSRRVFATLIDYGFFFLVLYVYMIYFGEETPEGYSVSGLLTLPIFIFWLVYFVLIEGIWQATIGHQLMYLKVCQENYDSIDFGHSFKRRILDLIDFAFFGIPAFVAVGNSERKQRIGDMYAKTLVIEDE